MNAVLIFAIASYFLAQSAAHPTFEEDVDPSDETEYDQIQAESDRRGNKMSITMFSIRIKFKVNFIIFLNTSNIIITQRFEWLQMAWQCSIELLQQKIF